VGEIFVPEGTNVNWNFFTDNTDTLKIVWGKQPYEALLVAENQFRFTKKAKESLYYKVLVSNNKVAPKDSLNYMFKVLKDAYPIVDASEVVDSTQLKMKYFKGEIRDDYGFEKLLFVIENGHTGWDSIIPLKININVNKDNFFFVFDMRDNQMGVEDYFEYHFEVYDNDGVNGSKMSQSRSFEFKIPSKEELQEQQEEKTEELKADLEQSVNLAKELQEEFEQLRKKLLTKEELSWEDKQQIKGVLDKQRLLEKSIDYVAQQNKKKNAMKEQFSKQDQRILDKQTQLQELMDDLMTEEMRQLFDDMEQMMEDMKTDDWMQKLEEMQMSNEDLEKELDRNLEMLKKFEFEEALGQTIEELQELIDKQEQLKEDNDSRIQPQEETTKSQEELRGEFDKVSEKIDELHRKNQSLEKQENLSLTEDLQNKVSEKMQESVESSQKNKRKKTSEAQKSSVDQMQKLQEKLKQAQASPSESGPSEDMNALRQILENLIDLSLDEERLLTELSEIKTSDPQYIDFIFWQNKLSDDSKVLEDSLYALSKRQAQIKATINREISAINKSIKKSLANMSERETSLALNHQQLVMTSANNLALMLSDILQSMQEDQANKTPGEQQCNKPGSGNPSPGDIKKMQEQLKKQIEQMKKGAGQGKKPKPSQGKDLAIMMGRQEMIRQQLEKMAEKLGESENGQTKRLQDAIKKMEQTEVDIVNDNITKETLLRQNQIIEHLLQAENAEQERDKESKREAKEGRPLPHHVEDVLIKYQETKRKQAELLKTIPPTLKPFYKSRVNDYFLNLE
jgi:myosin heavy subunit